MHCFRKNHEKKKKKKSKETKREKYVKTFSNIIFITVCKLRTHLLIEGGIFANSGPEFDILHRYCIL